MQKKNPFLFFAAQLLGSYGLWKILSYFLEENEVPQWIAIKNAVAAHIVKDAAWMSEHIFRIDVIYNSRNILQEGRAGIFLADHCIGVAAAIVFTIFIVIYQGSWKNKIWFIPMGIYLIFLINSVRLAALVYVQKYYSAAFFQLAHTEVFLVMIYGLIFLLIVWWVEIFATLREKKLR